MSDLAVTKSIRMYPKTLDCVQKLQELMKSPSFSDTVKNAVEISEIIVNAICNGERVIIEPKKGRQRQLLLAGLNR